MRWSEFQVEENSIHFFPRLLEICDAVSKFQTQDNAVPGNPPYASKHSGDKTGINGRWQLR